MNLLERLSTETILADGAMGTMLHAHGIGFEKCFDELNLTKPSAVAEIHRAYIEAGAELIITNTFGANRFKLAKHGWKITLSKLTRQVWIWRKRVVSASFKDVMVAGDVGPLGVRIAPFGRVQPEQARAAFAEQIKALAEAGADLIVIETFSDLMKSARRSGLRRNPVTYQSSPQSLSRGMTARCLAMTQQKSRVCSRDAGVDVIGVNCSGGPAQLSAILKQMVQAVPDRSGKFWVKPNAGWPEQVGGRIMYPADAEYFGEYALSFREAGACIVGGCCGTTPQHMGDEKSARYRPPNRSTSYLLFPQDEITETVQEQPTQFARRN